MVLAGVPQGSVLGPLLYLLFTAALPLYSKTHTSTFADDTAILSTDANPITASKILQDHIHLIEAWLKKWRIKVNQLKSVHVTFTLRHQTCPPVSLNGTHIPQADEAKYLGMHFDKKLKWRQHIDAKRKQLNIQLHDM